MVAEISPYGIHFFEERGIQNSIRLFYSDKNGQKQGIIEEYSVNCTQILKSQLWKQMISN